MKDHLILGIHKSLLTYTFVVLIASVLVVGMGLMLLANVFIPEVLFLEAPDLSGKVAFVCFGSIFVIFGVLGGIMTFLHHQKVTRIVLGTQPEPARIRLIEEKWSDSTELMVEFEGSHYLAKRPGWFKQDLLETPLEAEGYFDSQKNMVAVKLQQGLIWIRNSRNHQRT